MCFARNSSVWTCERHLFRLDVQQTFPANMPTLAIKGGGRLLPHAKMLLIPIKLFLFAG